MKSKIHEDHSRKNKILSKKLIILLYLLTSWWTQAQISIVEDFENTQPASWTYNGFSLSQFSCFGNSTQSLEGGISFETSNATNVSNGQAINVNFDWAITGDGVNAAGGNELFVSYSINNGNWVTFYATNQIDGNLSCTNVNTTIPAGTIPTGATFKLKISRDIIYGQSLFYVDDLFVKQYCDLVLPVNKVVGNVTINSVFFEFGQSAGADSYDYFITSQNEIPVASTSPSGNQTISSTTGTAGTSITGLLPSTNYRLYLRAKNVNGCFGEWASPYIFSTLNCTTVIGVAFGSNSSNISSSSATVTWTQPTPVPFGYDIYVQIIEKWKNYVSIPYNVVPTSSTNTTTFNFTGLEPGTEYEFFVRPKCSSGNPGRWDKSGFFKTLCTTYNPSYTQNFETFLPTCWRQFPQGTIASGPTGIENNGTWFGNRFLNTNSNSNAAKVFFPSQQFNSWLISPSINMSVGGLRVKFNYGLTLPAVNNPGNFGSDDSVKFVVSQNGGLSWTVLTTFNSTSNISNTSNTYILNLPTFTNVDTVFAFVASNGTIVDANSGDFFIDNFIIEPIPCQIPNNSTFTTSSVTTTTATLNWTAPSPTPSAGYDVYVSTLNTSPTVASIVSYFTLSGNSVSINAINLTPATQYYFWVRSVCSNTSSSAWSSAGTFTTLSPPCGVPTGLTVSNITTLGATISWTAPTTAPANSYSVYLSNTNVAPLANINDSNVAPAGQTSYVLDDQDPNYTQYVWVRSLCSSTNKSTWVGPISFTTLAQQTSIPDINFENKLIALGIDSGTPDGKVLTSSINTLTSLNVANSNISNLDGIQDFIALTSLSCNANNLTTLNIANSPNLTLLNCNNNQLFSINLASNFSLTELYCNYNSFTAINVSNLTALTKLGVSYNQLNSINVASNLNLVELACSYNQIASLNLAINTNLIALYCNNNLLTNLNIKNGNNTNFTIGSSFLNNPNLTCITVDNVAYSNANWLTYIDAIASYSTNCSSLQCFIPQNLSSSNLSNTTATISWTVNGIPPTNGFEYYVSVNNTNPSAGTIATGTNAANGSSAGSTVFQNLTGLTANTVYYVWVRSTCSATSSSNWTNAITFTTLAEPVVCNAPTGLQSPLVAQTTATIGWTFVTPTPANGYAYYLSTSATIPTLTTMPTGTVTNASNAANLSGLTAGTQYYFWVRSICSNTSSSAWSTIGTFTTLASAPTCNFPTNIAISSITQTTALLSWNASIPAPGFGFGYDYYISISATSPTAITSATVSASGITSLTLNDLVANTTYYLWMRTNCSATSKSAWSAVNSFTTLPVSNSCQAVLAGSIGANSITTTGANVFWIAPASAPANGYDIYISTTNVAPVGTVNTTYYTLAGNIVSLSVNDLANNTTYYVWVRSYCSGTSQSAWAGGYSFTTGTLASTTFDNNNFVYFPNPVTDNLTLKLKQNIDKVEISNLLGQILLDKKFDTNSSEIDFSSYPSGNYLVKVISNNESKIIKIIKN